MGKKKKLTEDIRVINWTWIVHVGEFFSFTISRPTLAGLRDWKNYWEIGKTTVVPVFNKAYFVVKNSWSNKRISNVKFVISKIDFQVFLQIVIRIFKICFIRHCFNRTLCDDAKIYNIYSSKIIKLQFFMV